MSSKVFLSDDTLKKNIVFGVEDARLITRNSMNVLIMQN